MPNIPKLDALPPITPNPRKVVVRYHLFIYETGRGWTLVSWNNDTPEEARSRARQEAIARGIPYKVRQWRIIEVTTVTTERNIES